MSTMDYAEEENRIRILSENFPGGSGDRKLKIKYLKVEEEEEEEQGLREEEDPKIGPQVCVVCKKGFGSAKALGGHKRVHARELKKQQQQQQQQELDHSSEIRRGGLGGGYNAAAAAAKISPNTSANPTCPVCFKNFPSMKALFGHMRCHPDRGWRGMKEIQPLPLPLPPPPPPPPAAAVVKNNGSSSPSTSDLSASEYYNQKEADEDEEADDDMGINHHPPSTDLSKCLPGWASTAKRGRSSLTSSGSGATAASEDNLRGNLMTLAHEAVEFEATNSDSAGIKSNQRRIETSPFQFARDCPDYTDKGKRKANSDRCVYYPDSSRADRDERHYYADDDEYEYSDGLNAAKKKLRDLESVRYHEITSAAVFDYHKIDRQIGTITSSTPRAATNNFKYKCGTCDRRFPTHQALGGHSSSHYKDRHKKADEYASEDHHQRINDNYPLSPVEVYGEILQVGASSKHRCKICSMCFPTGQALGGHQRRHYSTGPPPSQAASTPASSSPGEASGTKDEEQTGHMAGRKILLVFDLNEPPAMEDEDVNEEQLAHEQISQ